jgi:hypothetical protein
MAPGHPRRPRALLGRRVHEHMTAVTCTPPPPSRRKSARRDFNYNLTQLARIRTLYRAHAPLVVVVACSYVYTRAPTTHSPDGPDTRPDMAQTPRQGPDMAQTGQTSPRRWPRPKHRRPRRRPDEAQTKPRRARRMPRHRHRRWPRRPRRGPDEAQAAQTWPRRPSHWPRRYGE